MEEQKRTCACKSCVYGRRIRELINRTEGEEDKKFLEELFDNQFHAEDDRDYWQTLAQGYRKKFGPMSFGEAAELLATQKS